MASFSDDNRKFLPGEIKSLPNSQDILRLLECPCCLEAPVPPIKTCTTGHIICSFCRPRLTRCAICREPYTECRNYPLEAIFNGCSITCKFWGRGCQQTVLGCKYTDHVKVCQYRALSCSHCEETISPVDQYVNHLRDEHQAKGYDQEQELYVCKNTLVNLYNDIRFPDQYALFDGRYFIISAQIRSNILNIWLSLVTDLNVDIEEGNVAEGPKLAAIKRRAEESLYTAVITITPEERTLPEAKWTIPVFPLQNGDPDPALIVNIPVHPTFRGFLTSGSDNNTDVDDSEGAAFKYSWCFTYCLAKVYKD